MFGRTRFKLFLYFTPILFILAVVIFLTTTKKTIPASACASDENLTGFFDPESTLAMYEGKELKVPEDLATVNGESKVLGSNDSNGRWIEVDLSEQKLKAWDGNSLFLETPVSTGLPWTPTPTGEFKIWVKLRYTKMEGGSGKYYYNLPNVPYVMFFENGSVPGWKGYGLHGTYWHNDFGRQHSHGCVNLPTPIAEKLYYWVTPNLAEGKASVFASDENSGTKIVIHE